MNNTFYFEIGGILWKITSEFEYSVPDNVLEFQIHSPNIMEKCIEILVESDEKYDIDESEAILIYSNNEWLEVKQMDMVQIFTFAVDNISPITKLVYSKGCSQADIYINNKMYNKKTMVSLVESTPFLMLNMLVQLENEGFLMHTSAININQKGFLFSGVSGAGKTTLTRLIARFSDSIILTDETAIIRLDKNKILVYGTPWKGSGANYYSHQYVVLKQINFIYHGSVNGIYEMSANDAMLMMLKQSFPYFWDKKSIISLIAVLKKTIEIIPVKKMYFLPDETIVNFLLNCSKDN